MDRVIFLKSISPEKRNLRTSNKKLIRKDELKRLIKERRIEESILPSIEFTRNRSAVSDVLGEILMTTIAVIIISSIAVFIFSYDGAADVPRIQVREWMDAQKDTIYLEHSGGEFIDTESFEIVVNVNGTRHVYRSPQISANLNKNSWELGDRIEIDTYSVWNVDIKEEDEINVYLIDKPSNKVFQNLRLSTEEL